MKNAQLATATFAGGCFWCTEAIFRELRGIEDVVSGYSGGTMPHPKDSDIYTGETGHAEAIQITFDPNGISYTRLVEIFFLTHDPTTINQQGNDVGTHYRSVIFYHDDAQRETAEKIKEKIEEEHMYDDPIVTQIIPFTNFYPAERYHQNFYEVNPQSPYCQFVITPKLAKFCKRFSSLLKSQEES